MDMMPMILLFSLVSIVYISFALINFAAVNDYVFYEMQNITETLERDAIIRAGTANFTLSAADSYRTTNLHIDDFWLFLYMVFFISTLITAYKTRQKNYYSFLSIMFYGIMFILFLLSIFASLTDWFNEQVLLRALPNAIILLPKFYFFLEHIGIFTSIQVVACLVVNQLNFDFATIRERRKKEITDSEVL